MGEMRRRDMIAGAGAAAIFAGIVGFEMTRPRPVVSGELAFVDPALRDAVAGPAPPDLTPQSLPVWRAASVAAPRRRLPPPAPQPALLRIPGPRGAPAVRIILIDPGGAGRRAAYLYIHGGGFVLGTVRDDVATLQKVARDHGCLVVSVDYRLAPETRFPGALEESYAALKWLHGNAEALRVDARRIVVGGASAGGGHAAALAIAARDRGETPIAFQLLIYPMLDDRTGSVRPAAAHTGVFLWTPGNNRVGWSALLGEPAGSPVVPPGAAPARVANLAGLPPTFIGVGALDLFAPEDVDYARRLVAAKVPTELLVAPGAYHGFDLRVPDAEVSRRFTAAWNAALARGLGGAPAERPA